MDQLATGSTSSVLAATGIESLGPFADVDPPCLNCREAPEAVVRSRFDGEGVLRTKDLTKHKDSATASPLWTTRPRPRPHPVRRLGLNPSLAARSACPRESNPTTDTHSRRMRGRRGFSAGCCPIGRTAFAGPRDKPLVSAWCLSWRLGERRSPMGN